MFIAPAYAQAAGSAGATGGGLLFVQQFAPFILIFVVFWFLLIRPQQQRQRTLQKQVEGVKKNDTVVTAGGIVGKVTRVDDAHVEVEIAPNTRVRIVKATLGSVTPAGGKPAND